MSSAPTSRQLEEDEGDDAPNEQEELELQQQEEAYQRQYENEHSWENLREDDQGLLHVDRTGEMRARRKRLLSAAQSARIRKGMIRYLLLVIDLSRSASAQDLRPNRLSCMLAVCKAFVREFFDQNPLSQLGIAVMRNGVAERLTELSGSPEAQVKELTKANLGADGDASLQNAIDLGVSTLRSVPPYGHREVLLLLAALSSCDPGSVAASIKTAKEQRIRLSVVGVAAEVYVCRRMADDTGGTYGVALHEQHLEELMMAHAPPPPATAASAGAEQVRMGFPRRNAEDNALAVYAGAACQLTSGSYTCPRCKARAAELPCECHVCGLTLISSPHLARSYHHLFPVAPFEELPTAMVDALAAAAAGGTAGGTTSRTARGGASTSAGTQASPGLRCFGCLRHLADGGSSSSNAGGTGASALPRVRGGSAAGARGGGAGGDRGVQEGRAGGGGGGLRAGAVPGAMVLRCKECAHVFCYECDLYVHEHLHNCPGCECVEGGDGGDGGGPT